MYSFAEGHKSSLVQFFAEAVQSRTTAIFNSTGSTLDKWIADNEEKDRIRSLCPAIQTVAPITGIHAEAFLLERCVVKTNVFDEFYRDGQMSWLKWCARNQSNPLVPRIALLLIDEQTERFLAVMERLVPHSGFKQHAFSEEIDSALRSAFQKIGSGPAFRRDLARVEQESLLAIKELTLDKDHFADPIEHAEILHVMDGHIERHQHSIAYIDQLRELDKSLNSTHRRFFKQIQNKFHAAKCYGQVIDVHGFNWMLRENGDFVLLDPIN